MPKVKLDLVNSRAVHLRGVDSTVFDSVEDQRVGSTLRLSTDGKLSSSFKSTKEKIAPVEFLGVSGPMRNPKVDRFGGRCDLQSMLEHGPRTVVLEDRPVRYTDVAGNPVAEKFFNAGKRRIAGGVMSRILDNTHDVPAVTLYGNVVAGRVAGGYWNKGKDKDMYEVHNHLGPGDYDVKRPGDQVTVTKFSQVETHREPIDSKGSPVQPPLYPRRPGSAESAAVRFSKAERFDKSCPEYRKEFFVKTNGMKLSHDFDRRLVDYGKLDPKIGGKGPRMAPNRNDVVDVDVAPDCGPKMSLATQAQKTVQAYANVFKSSAQVGMRTPRTTSLRHVGPGYYNVTVNDPTMIIKNPDTPYGTFMRDRDFPTPFRQENSFEPELKSFQEEHNRGIHFNKTGKNSGNVHLQEWTRSKIIKIYPRLGRRKYGAQEVDGSLSAANLSHLPNAAGESVNPSVAGSLTRGSSCDSRSVMG